MEDADSEVVASREDGAAGQLLRLNATACVIRTVRFNWSGRLRIVAFGTRAVAIHKIALIRGRFGNPGPLVRGRRGAGRVSGMRSAQFHPFPNTHWSLVRRAGGVDASDPEARREALSRLLARYEPALKSYLRSGATRMPDQ